MKKVLVLMLVFGLTSIAGAATNTDKIVQLSVDGVVADEYFADDPLEPTDTVVLDIMLADGVAMDAMELCLEVIGPASILPEPPGIIVIWPPPYVVWQPDSRHICIAGVSFAPVDGKLVDGILLHCDGYGAVTVQLTIAGSNHIVAPEDRLLTAADLGSIVIHQVPEPMTITLLGFGSMFLLLRRK